MQSMMGLFPKTDMIHVRKVLLDLKFKQKLKMDGLKYGQLFESSTVFFFTSEKDFPVIAEHLITNGLKIYAYNSVYEKILADILEKVNKNNARWTRKDKSNKNANNSLLQLRKPKIKQQFADLLDRIGGEANNIDVAQIDKYCELGKYEEIYHINTSNPELNKYAKDKYVLSVKNAIELTLAKGLSNQKKFDDAVDKFKFMLTDRKIKEVMSEDLVSEVGEALILLLTEKAKEELISICNMNTIPQRINLLTTIHVSNLIFEENSSEIKDAKLLLECEKKLSTRFVMLCYDVEQSDLNEEQKLRFNLLINKVKALKGIS